MSVVVNRVGATAGDTTRHSVARCTVGMVLLGIGYYLTARLSQGLLFRNSHIGVVWVPTALMLSALILTPRKAWSAVLLVAAIAHVIAMSPANPAWRMAWQIAANTLAVVGAFTVLRRVIVFPLRFESRRALFLYAGVVLLMPVMLALITPAFVLSVAGVDARYSPAVAFTRVALGNMSPLVLVTPAVVLWGQFDLSRLRALSKRSAGEAAITIGTGLFVSIVVLSSESSVTGAPWLLLLTFPPLVWAAVRLGPTGASTLLLLVAALSIWGASQQLGPFVSTANADVVLSLQVYWIVIGPPVLLLAAVVRERERVEATLHDHRSQLARATRLATAGELSGALAHELRQPMTSILANAQAGLLLLAKGDTDVALLREILEDIVQQDQRASNVISRIRSLLKGDSVKLEPVTLEVVVRDAVMLTRSTAALAGVQVQSHIPSTATRVRGDYVQLLQVLVNLIVNGCESMADASNSDRILRLRVEHSSQDRVEVEVGDSGVGLPVNGEERVFETFFTTKDDGLGLGLSIGRSIASVHGGRLWAENNSDRSGATFHLELPTYGEKVEMVCS
jgi:signal transduction histidine kinase